MPLNKDLPALFTAIVASLKVEERVRLKFIKKYTEWKFVYVEICVQVPMYVMHSSISVPWAAKLTAAKLKNPALAVEPPVKTTQKLFNFASLSVNQHVRLVSQIAG